MKNKTKVVVALASLLAVTGGIGAYSTFAWFSTTNTATVNVQSLTVYNRGNFTIGFSKNSNTPTADTSLDVDTQGNSIKTGSEYTLTSSVKNGLDISGDGDGAHFLRPKWVSGYAGSQVIDSTSAYESMTNTVDAKYFVTFDMNFKNNGATDLRLVLDKGSSVSGVTTSQNEDVYAAYSTRVSFQNTTDSSMHIWQYDQDHSADTTAFPAGDGKITGFGYLVKDAAGTDFKKNGATNDKTGITKKQFTSSDKIFFGDATNQYTDTTSTLSDARYLGLIPAATGATAGELTIRVCIWIEGTLKTTVDQTVSGTSQSIVGGKVNTKMILSGLAPKAD